MDAWAALARALAARGVSVGAGFGDDGGGAGGVPLDETIRWLHDVLVLVERGVSLGTRRAVGAGRVLADGWAADPSCAAAVRRRRFVAEALRRQGYPGSIRPALLVYAPNTPAERLAAAQHAVAAAVAWVLLMHPPRRQRPQRPAAKSPQRRASATTPGAAVAAPAVRAELAERRAALGEYVAATAAAPGGSGTLVRCRDLVGYTAAESRRVQRAADELDMLRKVHDRKTQRLVDDVMAHAAPKQVRPRAHRGREPLGVEPQVPAAMPVEEILRVVEGGRKRDGDAPPPAAAPAGAPAARARGVKGDDGSAADPDADAAAAAEQDALLAVLVQAALAGAHAGAPPRLDAGPDIDAALPTINGVLDTLERPAVILSVKQWWRDYKQSLAPAAFHALKPALSATRAGLTAQFEARTWSEMAHALADPVEEDAPSTPPGPPLRARRAPNVDGAAPFARVPPSTSAEQVDALHAALAALPAGYNMVRAI